ncbi:YqaJ viral recombinase family protein [Arthrobacter sp. KNU-44]|uniref:YqaJ viral recombinase family protein n=1 Tax=Arthrobacter sp. KNU-44 TaxID=3450744 RepID=UPI003F42F578
MSLQIFKELEQGTPEWLAARCGIVTASVVGQLVTKGLPDALAVECPKCQALAAEPCISSARKVPTPIKTPHDERAARAAELPPVYMVADNETSRGLTMILAAERITGHVEPVQPSRAMERGTLDEPYAREAYSEHHAPASELGFMIRQFDGFKIGYSPDGLVGEEGLIEIKSRAQKAQLKTVLADEVPAENMAQLQTGLLVSGRAWIDYTSYCGGMKLWVKRIYPDPAWHTAILHAAAQFEKTATEMVSNYLEATADMPMTERIDHFPELEITF